MHAHAPDELAKRVFGVVILALIVVVLIGF